MYLRSFWLLVLMGLLILSGYSGAQAIGLNDTELVQESPALVFPDYLQRSYTISVYEKEVQKHPDSSLLLHLLAAQYLKRFREVGDVEDLLRAEQATRRSLTLQPDHNGVSSMLLASALLSQHRFREALDVMINPQQLVPDNPSVVSLTASIEMELGNYEAANQLLQSLPNEEDASSHSAVIARYQELTGNLALARQLLDRAMQQMDFYTNQAETRAWFHVRAGDLAFTAGELALSEQRYREALDLFPLDLAAFTGLARLYAAQHRWQEALDAANQGIERVPLVETLGYKADAQKALGDLKGAAETAELIEVVGHLSKVKGIYDRALAVYYVEHGIHLPEALEIAQREVAVRDDIFAEDTLAWAAAANGHWKEAQRAAHQATRYRTEDALLLFHAGMIALHCGNQEEAIKQLAQAIRLNPHFHHKYSGEAHRVLADIAPDAMKQYSLLVP